MQEAAGRGGGGKRADPPSAPPPAHAAHARSHCMLCIHTATRWPALLARYRAQWRAYSICAHVHVFRGARARAGAPPRLSFLALFPAPRAATMLAAKKKKEAEAAAAAAEAAEAASAAAAASSAGAGSGGGAAAGGESKKVSLFGGDDARKATGAGPAKKKMKPGEIRVQKGACRRPGAGMAGGPPRGGRARARRRARRPLTLPAPPHPPPPPARADIAELDAGRIGKVTWPEPSDLTNMLVDVTPDQGLWRGATFAFSIKVPEMYPHEPPKVLCLTKVSGGRGGEGCVPRCVRAGRAHTHASSTTPAQIYHPNIDLEGHVCLNILRDEWKPVLDINAVIYGIIYLFYEPNPNDPLNHGAFRGVRARRHPLPLPARVSPSPTSPPPLPRRGCRPVPRQPRGL
jgi:ubiquitin-conjugating enzyme E2 M